MIKWLLIAAVVLVVIGTGIVAYQEGERVAEQPYSKRWQVGGAVVAIMGMVAMFTAIYQIYAPLLRG